MSFLFAIDENQIGLDATVWRQDDRAIPHALKGLDAFGEVYFLALSVGHRTIPPIQLGISEGISILQLADNKQWRRGRDSNPRYPFGYAGFQDRSHQPLGHLSGGYRFMKPGALHGFSLVYNSGKSISGLGEQVERFGMKFHDLGKMR